MSGCFSPLHWRWRNFPKPSIAAVQGRVFAGGLMITWPTGLIVASEDACFADPVTAFGTSAVELFMHPWELGARRAKERLLTGDVAAAPESRGALFSGTCWIFVASRALPSNRGCPDGAPCTRYRAASAHPHLQAGARTVGGGAQCAARRAERPVEHDVFRRGHGRGSTPGGGAARRRRTRAPTAPGRSARCI